MKDDEIENYRQALAVVYNTLKGERPTDFLKPLNAQAANELAEFCKQVYNGKLVSEYFEEKEEE